MQHRKALLLTLLTLLCTPWLVSAATMLGTVVKVSDGDTVTLQVKTKEFKVRMSEIDTPESCQAYGLEAMTFVRTAVLGQTVRVTWSKLDHWQRRLGTVYLADGASLNALLVERGLAWAYTAFHPSLTILALEREARHAQIGLWQEPSPLPPWTFRKRHGPCPVQKGAR